MPPGTGCPLTSLGINYKDSGQLRDLLSSTLPTVFSTLQPRHQKLWVGREQGAFGTLVAQVLMLQSSRLTVRLQVARHVVLGREKQDGLTVGKVQGPVSDLVLLQSSVCIYTGCITHWGLYWLRAVLSPTNRRLVSPGLLNVLQG
jgi:hypothetical protein